MASLAVLGVRIDSAKALAGLHALDNKLNKVGLSGKAVGANLVKFGKIAGLAIGGLGIMSIKTSGDFEQSMNKVSAIGGSTGKTLLALENQARDLGKTTEFSASQAADGMTFLAMAGFDAQQTMAAMPGILNLASASGTDLATSADIASNILSGLGLAASDTGKLVDVMAKGTSSANMNVMELGEAMKIAAPMADTAGLSMHGLTAIIGKMADAGIKGSLGGTALRRGIAKLLIPTEQAKKAFKDLDVEFKNSDGSMRNLINIMGDLEDAGVDATDMVNIFGVQAGPTLMASMKQGVGAIKELRGELEASGGTAQKMADIQLQGLNGALKKLNSAWEELQIKFGKTGVLSAVTIKIEELTTALGSPEAISMIESFGNGVLAVGSAMKSVFDVYRSMPEWVQSVGIVMAFLGGRKAKAIVVGATALAGVIGWIYDGVSGLFEKAKEAQPTLDKLFQSMEDANMRSTFLAEWEVANPPEQPKLPNNTEAQAAQLTWLDNMKNSWNGVKGGLQEYIDTSKDAENKTKALSDVGLKFATSMEDAFVTMAMGGKVSFKDMARSIIADLIRIQIRQGMVNAMSFGGGLGGMFKAEGGTVTGNQPYIVGEEGPELFMPSKTGTIIPNDSLGGSKSQSSDVNVSFNITANDTNGFDELLSSRRGLITGIINQAMNDRGLTGVTT